MTDASLRYEIEQLKRKLLQTQEERDRAMSNCHELWKRLNSLISLAASTTASYTLSNSGLPTSPSDSYDSRSKSTSPNSSSAASLNDSLLSTSNGITTSSNNNNNNNNSTSNNSTNNNNNNESTHASIRKLSNGSNPSNTTLHHHAPLNLKSINAIKTNHHHHNNSTTVFHASNNIHQFNGNNNNNNTTTNNNNPSNITISGHNNNHMNSNSNNLHHSPLNLKSINAIKDINNNHPLIAEVAKVTTVGEIEEIAPGQFKCRYCDKTFDRIFSVHRHERVHTGFKPCVCKA